MNVNVGSKNIQKVNAVKEVLKSYNIFGKPTIVALDVPSGVSEQPKSLEETIQGAINRSKTEFMECECKYSFGIESGIMEVPYTKSGYMDLCACSIYDGKQTAIGLSSAFEFPIKVTKLIHEEGLDANEAFFRSGLTKNPK